MKFRSGTQWARRFPQGLESVTADVSQPLMSWLKEPAPPNMRPMSVIEVVSQRPMAWSKSPALRNVSYVLTTADVSQPPMSLLNT